MKLTTKNKTSIYRIIMLHFIVYCCISNSNAQENYVSIPEGTFIRGNDKGGSDEIPEHKVMVSKYEINKYPVTVADWKKYCQSTQAKMPDAPAWGWKDTHPIINISWFEAVAYCEWLSINSTKVYRLPTDAEWEYAAKGAIMMDSFEYSGSNKLEEVAWYSKNSNNQTQAIGQKNPNRLGIFDMTGNVREWCNDWYGKFQNNMDSLFNPKGPETGHYKVVRGGSWDSPAYFCRNTARSGHGPYDKLNTVGFRLVIDVNESNKKQFLNKLHSILQDFESPPYTFSHDGIHQGEQTILWKNFLSFKINNSKQETTILGTDENGNELIFTYVYSDEEHDSIMDLHKNFMAFHKCMLSHKFNF